MARIRSLKPQVWQDEKIGHISRDARLLFVGLITLADDEGRFLTLPSVVLGHAFPRDGDAARKLPKWFEELKSAGLIRLYDDEYGCLPNWTSHQKISHPTPSILPAPPQNGSGGIPE
jgi:hypothetical protein